MPKPDIITVASAPSFASLQSLPANAEAPDLKTPAPVNYLVENLDEADGPGWCIDTLGRGFATDLQTHSCNPKNGDGQYSFRTGAVGAIPRDGSNGLSPDVTSLFDILKGKEYSAMLAALDTGIGRLFAALDDDTIIMFIGDNGSPNQVTHGFFGDHCANGTIHEGGTHVPFVVTEPALYDLAADPMEAIDLLTDGVSDEEATIRDSLQARVAAIRTN